MGDEDDEGGFGGMYESGHWVWDESNELLVFVSDLQQKAIEAITMPTKPPTGTIEFRDDVDLVEQIRFRKRYQRKVAPGHADVITVQDVKDIALYTAPVNILSPMLINVLHLSTTERFLRALILCCQYYLQIAEEMTGRIVELETKVRTPECDIIETEFHQNISDLRLLAAKEYSTMLLGGSDTKKFHHMGPQKKRRSLSDKDARLMETLIRMCVQIVWLALGRKSFNQIELEVNRIFKTEVFNAVEHQLRTGYITNMAPEERAVLLGPCLRPYDKLNGRSPMINEVFCHRPIDYRLMGVGVIKYQTLTTRLRYMQRAVSMKEDGLEACDVVVGILGMSRSKFDTMLNPLSSAAITTGAASQSSRFRTSASTDQVASKKSSQVVRRIYPNIVLPPHEEIKGETFPESFPEDPEVIRPCSETQRIRWQNRLVKLLRPHKSTCSVKTFKHKV